MAEPNGAHLLEIDAITVRYGNIEAVRDVSFYVDAGEIVTLIGGNGAGKTTTLKTISGIRRVARGKIRLEGKSIERLRAHEIVARGISQSPEGRHIFPRMSVRENLEMGAFQRRGGSLQGEMENVFTLFPVLKERLTQAGGTLSGGEQQMLAIGRALVARPSLLLLDEPSLGLAPKFITRIFQTLRELKKEGKTILLVEQNARQALQVADRGYVMERGRIVLTGSGHELLNMPEVQRTYLGQHAA
jgi:branched-chain amino acid transport system ATP-binding protein